MSPLACRHASSGWKLMLLDQCIPTAKDYHGSMCNQSKHCKTCHLLWSTGTSPDAWLPLTLHLGVPLYCLHLCKDVCARASAASFLTAEARAAHRSGLQQLQAQLWQLISQHALGTSAPGGDAHQSNPAALLDGVVPVELPIANLLFDGTNIQVLDMSDCCQGTACLVAGN